jgi:hypothetical protein
MKRIICLPILCLLMGSICGAFPLTPESDVFSAWEFPFTMGTGIQLCQSSQYPQHIFYIITEYETVLVGGRGMKLNFVRKGVFQTFIKVGGVFALVRDSRSRGPNARIGWNDNGVLESIEQGAWRARNRGSTAITITPGVDNRDNAMKILVHVE